MLSPSTSSDFNFGGGRSSAWVFCVSAPTSPNRGYKEFDQLTAAVDQTDEFAFHVSKGDAMNPTVSAAELFHAGKIRPLCGGVDAGGEVETIRSPLLSSSTPPTSSNSKEDPNWSNAKKTFWSAFTPKRHKPTNAHAPKSPSLLDDDDEDTNGRGRGRVPCLSSSSSRRRGTRSLSPIRLTNYPLWEANEYDDDTKKKKDSTNPSSNALTPSKSSRMKKLKNFLLFRSASEGRAPAHKSEPLKKLAAVSAHERHYAMKKAASEDLKKKTFLPYKRGILGR
ncbi:hypothetical protein V2J09_017096 [Rumex salicifolius]